MIFLILLAAGLAATPAGLAAAQPTIQPIVIRDAKDHPDCQIYLKAHDSRLLYR